MTTGLWTIRLIRNYEVVSEFEVPEYRLGKDGLANLMRAIFVSNVTEDPKAFTQYYLNDRRGKPKRSSLADLTEAWHPETRERGYACGYPELSVTAMQVQSQEVWDAIEEKKAENREAANLDKIKAKTIRQSINETT
ncbi:MAG: hypothetical protein AAF557_22465 [Pseudomonadota bacterium]